MSTTSFLAVAAVLLAGALPLERLSAHGLETEQSKIVGEYAVEFAYASYAIWAGEPSQFIVRLFEEPSQESIEFDYAFLRFGNEQNVQVASARLFPDFLESNSARLLAVMPEAGAYAADVAFYRNDKIIAEATFDFPVEPPSQPGGQSWLELTKAYGWLLALTGGLVLGWAGGEALRRRK